MRIPRIYSPQALRGESHLTLDAAAARHVVQVLRLPVGAELVLFDGHGGQYRARITAADRRKLMVEVLEHQALECEAPLALHLLQGISRGERMDWVMQKATELGVASITPVVTARCGVKLSPQRQARRLEHWQGVIVAACEQCGRNRLPRLEGVQDLARALGGLRGSGLVLDPAAGRRLGDLPPPVQELTVLIGPEGGLTAEEVRAAAAAGFEPVSLGPRVLRTETAALAVLAALQARWGDL